MAKNGKVANGKGGAAVSNDAALKALEKAKAKFAEANAILAEKRKEVTKAKRLLATGDKRIEAMDKKIEEIKQAPSKAADILLKKAEEMERRAAEMAAEQDRILADAQKIEARLEKKAAEVEKAKEAADAEMEAMGIPKVSARSVSSGGSSSERRARNNFQYRLRSKGWNLNYNMKGRIESADKYGLHVDFTEEGFVVSKNGAEVLSHPYGEGSLVAIANAVKEHGEGVEAE